MGDPEIRVPFQLAYMLGASVEDVLAMNEATFGGWLDFFAWEAKHNRNGAGYGRSKGSRRIHGRR